MTMTAKKSVKRKQQQTLRRGRFARRKSAQRRSASTPKHENAFSAHQQPPASRAAIRRTSPQEGKAKVVVVETASRDRVTRAHLHERQLRVDANCSMHHIRRSPGQCMCRGEKKAAVAQGVDQARRICKRSPSANLEGLRGVEAGVLQAGAHTVLKLAHHELSKAGWYLVMRDPITIRSYPAASALETTS